MKNLGSNQNYSYTIDLILINLGLYILLLHCDSSVHSMSVQLNKLRLTYKPQNVYFNAFSVVADEGKRAAKPKTISIRGNTLQLIQKAI